MVEKEVNKDGAVDKMLRRDDSKKKKLDNSDAANAQTIQDE